MTTDLSTIEKIFTDALEIPNADDRRKYVATACEGDQELAGRVQQLLDAHFNAGRFMDRPAAAENVTQDLSGRREREGDTIGHYRLLQEIGEGGFGIVYMAEQSHPVQRKVAVKVIKPGMDTREVIARFEAERQALAVMEHPNIARVLDAGETPDGRPFFVMELIRGVPITEYCNKHQLATRDRLRLFQTVCRAVQHAHQKGIIHRDLKPSNVLITLQDGEAIVKVIDFGIAKALNTRLTDRTLFTRFDQMVGTPQYMSPEQAELSGLDIDTRCDIYSLGVLLYELVTGQPPFDSEDLRKAGLDEMRRIIREQQPLKPSTRLQSLDYASATTVAGHHGSEPRQLSRVVRGDLDWIVMKAIDKDRNRRYESADAFGADIHRHLTDEPVSAGPPSVVYRFRKWARKNRWLAATTAVILASLLIGIGTLNWALAIKTDSERRLANAVGELEAKKAELEIALADAHEGQLARERLQRVRQMELAAEFYNRGLELLRTGTTLESAIWNIKQAISIFEDIRSEEGKVHMRALARAYCLLGKTYTSLGQPELAWQALESGMHVCPLDSDSQRVANDLELWTAYQWSELGDEERLVAALMETVARNRFDLEPQWRGFHAALAGSELLFNGHIQESLEHFEQVIPDILEAREQGKNWITWGGRSTDIWVLIEHQIALDMARNLHTKSEAVDFTSSRQLINRLKEEHPGLDTTTSEMMIARLSQDHEKHVSLLHKYLQGKELPSTSDRFKIIRGNRHLVESFVEMGDTDRAVEVGREFVNQVSAFCEDNHPSRGVAKFSLSVALDANGETDVAIETLSEAFEILNSHPFASELRTLEVIDLAVRILEKAGRQVELGRWQERRTQIMKRIRESDEPWLRAWGENA